MTEEYPCFNVHTSIARWELCHSFRAFLSRLRFIFSLFWLDIRFVFQNTGWQGNRGRTEEWCCYDRYAPQCRPISKRQTSQRQGHQPRKIPATRRVEKLLCERQRCPIHPNSTGTRGYGTFTRCRKERKCPGEIKSSSLAGLLTFEKGINKKRQEVLRNDRNGTRYLFKGIWSIGGEI